jgi:putative SOS response-associated peptidase YedK
MCSHYQAEKRRHLIERRFGIALPADWEPPPGGSHIYPTQFAPIIRRPRERDARDEAVPDVEVVDARFGLLPGFATDVKYGTRTYNARSETVATLPSFKMAWGQARHCIVPCEAIYEPDWRTGTHVPTRFTAADGGTLGVAGLWQSWCSSMGEWVDTFTMLTLNADDHDLMSHMHRPDPKRPSEQQDKRMVVILPNGLYEAWLDAPAANSKEFMRQYPAALLSATPEPAQARPVKLQARLSIQPDLL